MFMLIRNEKTITGGWKTLTLAADETPQSVKLPIGPLLVPLPN
jgi:hypothetical protein